MTADDLHLLLEQARLSEEAHRLAGMRGNRWRPQLAQILQGELSRIGKWHGEKDAQFLAKYIGGELSATQLEAVISERLRSQGEA